MQVDIGAVFSDGMAPPGTSPLPAIPQLPQAPGSGRRCSSGATGTATGAQLPGHLTLAKLLGLHSHHVPMCQVDRACCFWNTYPYRHPERCLCDALVSEPEESHRAAVFIGTAMQRSGSLWLFS